MKDLIQRLRDEAKMWRGNIEELEATGCDEIELETADHERLIAALKEAADALERLTVGDVALPDPVFKTVGFDVVTGGAPSTHKQQNS